MVQIFQSNPNDFKTALFHPQMGPEQIPPLWVRENLGVIEIREYFTLLRVIELKLHRGFR